MTFSSSGSRGEHLCCERWLTSHRAPEGSRKRGERIARPTVLDPCVKQNRQARQIGKPEPGAYINCTKWQHARSQCSNAEPGHDGRSNRRNAAADENFSPGHAGRIEKLPGHRTHAAGLGHRGKRQGLARAMLPAWRCEPAEFFFGENFPVAPPGMQADDHRVEFPPIEALQAGRPRIRSGSRSIAAGLARSCARSARGAPARQHDR